MFILFVFINILVIHDSVFHHATLVHVCNIFCSCSPLSSVLFPTHFCRFSLSSSQLVPLILSVGSFLVTQ